MRWHQASLWWRHLFTCLIPFPFVNTSFCPEKAFNNPQFVMLWGLKRLLHFFLYIFFNTTSFQYIFAWESLVLSKCHLHRIWNWSQSNMDKKQVEEKIEWDKWCLLPSGLIPQVTMIDGIYHSVHPTTVLGRNDVYTCSLKEEIIGTHSLTDHDHAKFLTSTRHSIIEA